VVGLPNYLAEGVFLSFSVTSYVTRAKFQEFSMLMEDIIFALFLIYLLSCLGFDLQHFSEVVH
jgi:hypothetical protein